MTYNCLLGIIREYIKNFSLTISIERAYLLDGGEIRCDDTTSRNVQKARFPSYSEYRSICSQRIHLQRYRRLGDLCNLSTGVTQ